MSRPRTATANLEARGAFRKNPNRKRVDPASQGLLGDPPSRWTPADDRTDRAYIEKCASLCEIWHELAESVPVGVLTKADRFLVDMACTLIYDYRAFGLGGEFGLSSTMYGKLEGTLARLGCSPIDRAKVATAPDKQGDDELKEFD